MYYLLHVVVLGRCGIHGKAWWSSGHMWSVSLPLDLGFESRPEASPCRAISGAADRSVIHCTNKWIKHYRVRVAALCVRTDTICLPFWYLAAEGEECSKNILLYIYTIQYTVDNTSTYFLLYVPYVLFYEKRLHNGGIIHVLTLSTVSVNTILNRLTKTSDSDRPFSSSFFFT